VTFLEELTAHKGGLLLLKSELWWHGGRGYDGITGRVCLLMDAAEAPLPCHHRMPPARSLLAATFTDNSPAALLLVDGALYWVWVAQEDVELL